MLHWAKALWDDRLKDCLEVIVPSSTVLGIVNVVTLKAWFELSLLSVTILYTVWRWRRDTFVLCSGCLDNHPPTICPYPPDRRPSWCPKKL